MVRVMGEEVKGRSMRIARLTAMLASAPLLACGEPVSRGELVVGVLLDYTGHAASNGFNLERGALLANDLMTEARGGEPLVRFVFRDSGGDPERAGLAASELIDEGAVAVIGPTGDEATEYVGGPL